MDVALSDAPIREKLTQAQLKELLHYDPETGIFTWLISPCPIVRAGAVAGFTKKYRKGAYIVIRIAHRGYYAHQLAWLYITGKWPDRQIDHWDTDGTNNRWSNLRLATQTQNQGNVGLRRDNRSGFKGVSWDAKTKKWRANIGTDGQRTYLGARNTPEEAHELYKAAALKKFSEFIRLS